MMNNNLGKNLTWNRRNIGMTQAEVAEHLGVTPQAVSKWELGYSLPDCTMLPEIAKLFGVSIDSLFGEGDIPHMNSLVSRYEANPTEKNYRDACVAIGRVMEEDEKSISGRKASVKVKYIRSIQYLLQGQEECVNILRESENLDDNTTLQVVIQLLRYQTIFEKLEVPQPYSWEKITPYFPAKDRDYYELYILISQKKMAQVQAYAEESFASLPVVEKRKMAPLIMEAAVEEGWGEWVEKCFDVIRCYETDPHKILNGWWLLWQYYKNIGEEEKCRQCKDVLEEHIAGMEFEKEKKEQLLRSLQEDGKKTLDLF